MTAISGVSNSSSAWAAMAAQRSANQAKAFAKVDTDGSGSVDGTELQNMLDDVASKTGATAGNAQDVLSKYDANGDGSLSADELGSALKSILPPPSTMEFAQSRGADGASAAGSAGEGLFGKVDTDGSGGIDAGELQTLMDRMSGDGATSSASTASSGAVSDATAKRFAELDTNGDGTLSQAEFDAGRPSGGPQGAQASGGGEGGGGGHHGGGGGGGGGGKVEAASGSSSDASTTYDPLDTNQDGVVSAAELAAAGVTTADSTSGTDPLAALFSAADSNGDGKIGKSESDVLVQQIEAALSSMSSNISTTVSSASASSDTSGTDGGSANGQDPSQPFDLQHLAQMVLQQYEQVANNDTQTAASTLKAVA